MSSSSDTELELGQRSQPKVKTAAVIQSDETSPKKTRTSWDLMKSKSNKSFCKNYLQGMINTSPTVSNIHNPSQANVNSKSKPGTTSKVKSDTSSSDEEEIVKTPSQKNSTLTGSATKNKKVSFSEKVQKKNIEDVKSVKSGAEDDLQTPTSQETSKDIDMKLSDLDDSDDEIDSKPKQDKLDFDDLSEEGTVISQEKTKKKATTTRDAKKRNKFNSNVSENKNRSKFTITAQNEKIKYSVSSDMEDSSSSLSEDVTKKIRLKNQFKNTTITNKKSNIESTSSISHPPKNLKDLKKKDMSKSIPQNDTNSSDNSGTESTSSSDNKKSASKLKPISIHSKYNIEESSSSSEIPEKQAKNTSRNSINKRLSDTMKELKKRKINLEKKSESSDSDTSSKAKVAKPTMNKINQPESSGEEFVNSKLSRNSSLNKSSSSNKRSSLNKNSPIKSTKLKFNNSKSDSSGSDSDTTSHYKTKNEHLQTKLDTYSTLNNLKQITLKTYNLSKDLKNNDTEIYIAQIPKDVSPRLLADKLVFFDKPTVLDIENSTYTLNIKMDENMSRVILANTSKTNNNYFDLSSIKPTGILSVCKKNKLKEKSLKIHKEPTEEIIEEPKNLKEQHLLLGKDYADRAKLDKWISDKLKGLITSFNKKHKEKKSKRKSSEKRDKNQEEDIDIFTLLDERTEQKSLEENDESRANKKKKKRKSNQHEERTTAERSEIQESIDIINQLMLENELPYEEKSSRKHKKEKRQRSKSIFKDAPISEEEIVPLKRKRSKSLAVEPTEKNLEDDSLTSVKVSKKNKKAKVALENIQEFAPSDISSNKQTKSIVNSTMLSSAASSTSIFDQDKSAIPKDDDLSLSSFFDDLLSDMDVNVKKKKRKRKESSDEDTFLEEKRKKKNKVFL